MRSESNGGPDHARPPRRRAAFPVWVPGPDYRKRAGRSTARAPGLGQKTCDLTHVRINGSGFSMEDSVWRECLRFCLVGGEKHLRQKLAGRRFI